MALDTCHKEVILSKVKNIMSCVLDKLPDQDDKFNKFLKNKINNLETDKREVVGVFGKTGAGKSSLINAVIGEQDLLPSGSISACTSVMIKVEANMRNPKYEAEIEFITKEEWEEELNHFLGANDDQEKDEDDQDIVEKLSVLYGEEWKDNSPEHLMNEKKFKKIPEFLNSKIKYTRSESKDVKRLYWPLVKCVTVRVPKNRLLQHVTLVDLPGNGDRNKSRDTMWKKFVGSCSTVWIVAEINRAASEKESWEILEESCSLMGNGGECRQIHFICTKSDSLGGSDDQEPAAEKGNEGKREPFNGVINTFSLGTEKMMNKEYENVKLQLTFLKTELKRCPPMHKHIGLTPYVRMGPPLAVVNRGPCPPRATSSLDAGITLR
ncbi:hypothetical protein NQZ68_030949 [Dissostichus eleginoides]|nr:hypothetical protein NQZ68_030949 [Dissostichus eleginoides]